MPSLEVRGRVSADGKPWENTLRRAQAQAGQFAGAISSQIGPKIAAAFSVSALTAFAKSLVEMSGTIKDTATRLGITQEQVQVLSFVSKRNASSLDEVAAALDKIATFSQDLSEGGERAKEIAKALGSLGIEASGLKSKVPVEIFERMSSALSDTNITAEKTAAIIELLGRSGSKLIPTMQALGEESKMAVVIPNETIKQLDDAGKSAGFLGDAIKSLGSQALGGIMNPFDSLSEMLRGAFFTGDEELTSAAGGRYADSALAHLNANKTPKVKEPETASAEDLEALKRAQHQNEQDEVNKVEKETAKITQQAAEARMTDEEKLVALAKERAEIYEKINSLQYEPGTLKRAELDKRLAEIGLAEANASKKEKKGAKMDVPTDSLVRVGNFLGASSANTINAISQRSLDKLSSIDRYIKLMYERGAYGGATSSLSSNTP